jgi:hypothetical protein
MPDAPARLQELHCPDHGEGIAESRIAIDDDGNRDRVRDRRGSVGGSLSVVSPISGTRKPMMATGKDCNRYTFRSNAPAQVACRAITPVLLERGKKWYAHRQG